MKDILRKCCRLGFQFSVISGFRAHWNRSQHRRIFSRIPAELRLPATECVAVTANGPALIRFWYRKPGGHLANQQDAFSNWNWGMVAGRLVQPGIPADDYEMVCRMSHFGDAHFEAAFRYRSAECRIYAIKNTARDYCRWVNRDGLFQPLGFGNRRKEAIELYCVFSKVLEHYFETVLLEPPEECVALAVSPLLLPGNHQECMNRIFRRYEFLHNDLKASAESCTQSTSGVFEPPCYRLTNHSVS